MNEGSSSAESRGGVRREVLEDGQLWVLALDTPPANILDRNKIEALTKLFIEAGEAEDLKCVVLEGDGENFSFGASVEEHLPRAFERMIPAFLDLFRVFLASEVRCLAAVRGRCLGGGLELITPCMRVWAAPGASFGQPEVRLGVFPPVAALLLTDRVGQVRAEELCVSGRVIDAAEAERLGLVDEVVDDPSAAARAYAREHLLPKSASSLRLALRASRLAAGRARAGLLTELEALYSETLMGTSDAVEGLTAFVEKRAPQWSNR
jgi:cyclohexa-1,5-dienecarbonyl-CoA hydratase